jgi:hypothetical protein
MILIPIPKKFLEEVEKFILEKEAKEEEAKE